MRFVGVADAHLFVVKERVLDEGNSAFGSHGKVLVANRAAHSKADKALPVMRVLATLLVRGVLELVVRINLSFARSTPETIGMVPAIKGFQKGPVRQTTSGADGCPSKRAIERVVAGVSGRRFDTVNPRRRYAGGNARDGSFLAAYGGG